MAKRDFAHVQSQVKKGGGKEKMSAAMIAVSLIFTAVLAFFGGYMAGDRQNSTIVLQNEKATLQTNLIAQEKRIVELEQRLAASLEREKPAAKKAAAERVGDLTFYSELPKQKVMPSPLGDTGPAARQSKGAEALELRAAITRAGIRSVEKKTGESAGGDAGNALASYRLQVGSFIRRSDAEGLLNRMALAEVKAMISEAQVAGVGTRYRVYTGPHVGLAEAEGAKSLVREKLKITGLLLRE